MTGKHWLVKAENNDPMTAQRAPFSRNASTERKFLPLGQTLLCETVLGQVVFVTAMLSPRGSYSAASRSACENSWIDTRQWIRS
jgi:hypothetical protein